MRSICLMLFLAASSHAATCNIVQEIVNNGASTICIGEAWPVGSIFISAVTTNPNTLLGYGTWVAFSTGTMLVGIDSTQTEFDTLLETGGSKTHTLTTTEIPAHTHIQDAHNHGITDPQHNHTQNAHSHTVTSVGSSASGSTTNLTGASDTSSTTAAAANATATNQAASTGVTVNNATATNQNTGGGGSHSILNPYLVVFMWKRIS